MDTTMYRLSHSAENGARLVCGSMLNRAETPGACFTNVANLGHDPSLSDAMAAATRHNAEHHTERP